jgi:hypothetical protein
MPNFPFLKENPTSGYRHIKWLYQKAAQVASPMIVLHAVVHMLKPIEYFSALSFSRVWLSSTSRGYTDQRNQANHKKHAPECPIIDAEDRKGISGRLKNKVAWRYILARMNNYSRFWEYSG